MFFDSRRFVVDRPDNLRNSFSRPFFGLPVLIGQRPQRIRKREVARYLKILG